MLLVSSQNNDRDLSVYSWYLRLISRPQDLVILVTNDKRVLKISGEGDFVLLAEMNAEIGLNTSHLAYYLNSYKKESGFLVDHLKNSWPELRDAIRKLKEPLRLEEFAPKRNSFVASIVYPKPPPMLPPTRSSANERLFELFDPANGGSTTLVKREVAPFVLQKLGEEQRQRQSPPPLNNSQPRVVSPTPLHHLSPSSTPSSAPRHMSPYRALPPGTSSAHSGDRGLKRSRDEINDQAREDNNKKPRK